jgi:DNA-binding MarR family transcriptional regulator
VGDLLSILRITKQSLGRVLGDLLDKGFVSQATDAQDRRRRRLILTPIGADLERRLTEGQMRHIRTAWKTAGPDAQAGFRAVLRGMIDPADRGRFPDKGGP